MDIKSISPIAINGYSRADCDRAFALLLRELLNILKRKVRSESDRALVDRCDKRIGLVVATSGAGELLNLATDKFIEHRAPILERNEEYFRTTTALTPGDDPFVTDLINLIRLQYDAAKPAERDIVYSHFKNMLLTCIRVRCM